MGFVLSSFDFFEDAVELEYVEGLGFVVKSIRSDCARLIRGLGCELFASGDARAFPFATSFLSLSHISVGTDDLVDSAIRASGCERGRYAPGGGAVAARRILFPS